MEKRSAVLQYCLTEPNESKGPKWKFRFKDADGETLIESGRTFDSPVQAEQGFLEMLKLIATNQYRIDCPAF